MNKIILGNWKAHLSPAAGVTWLNGFLENYRLSAGIEVVLAVPVLGLQKLAGQLKQQGAAIKLASQNVSAYPPGSYSGATPASWLKGLADYVLVGHREQRSYFHLTLQDVSNQVTEISNAGLQPILCLEKKDAARQIAALESSALETVILAYTPSDAEQLEIARSSEHIITTVEYFSALSGGRPVWYGGGVEKNNVADLISLPGVSGVMVGRGCLEPQSFASLVANGAAVVVP